MYSERKFLELAPRIRAKRLSELLRIIVLQLGNDVAQARAEYEKYAEWAKLPADRTLEGKNQAQILDLYKEFRVEAGLGFERDVYLQSEPGDRGAPALPTIPYAVLAHNLRSAFNVGSVFRSADCFGFEAVHLSGYSAGEDQPALKSAARGCETWIPHRRWESPVECIEWHRARGYSVIALETGEGSVDIRRAEWPAKGLVILGNEELGIAPELLAMADLKIEIPMAGRKASMNVAGAFSILAYAARSKVAE